MCYSAVYSVNRDRIKYTKTNRRKIILQSNIDKNFLIRIYRDFRITNLENSYVDITNQTLGEISRRLQESGYFRQVLFKNKSIENCQIITFILFPNSKLKNISFYNNFLVISNKKIKRFFIQQIGLPQSLRQLNESCKNFKQIYFNKGFKWVRVNLYNLRSETLILSIVEGIIDHVEFHFISQRSLNIYNFKILKRQLALNNSKILNIKSLEQGLKFLKESQIFSSYKYQIVTSVEDNNKLLIRIKAYDLPQVTSYIFARQMFIGEQVLENLTENITNFLFKYPGRTFNNSKNLTQNFSTLYSAYNVEKLKYANLSHNLYGFFAFQQKPLLVKPSHSYGLRCHIKNLVTYNKQFFADLQFPDIQPLFDIYFFNPWMWFVSDKTSSFTLRVFKLMSELKIKNIATNYTRSKRVNDIFNTVLISQGIECKLSYNASSTIFLSGTIQFQHLGTSCSYIFYDPLKSSANSLVFCDYLLSFRSPLISFGTIDKLYREIEQQFLTFNIQLNKYTTNNQILPNKGYNLQLRVSQFFLLNHSLKQEFAHKIQASSIYYHDFTFFSSLPNKETIISNFELGWLFGHPNFLPLSEESSLSSVEIIRGYKDRNVYLSHYYYKSFLEYHLSIKQVDHTIFLFFDYGKSIKPLDSPYSTRIIPAILNNIHYETKKNLISVGIGVQLCTKFKKFPPLRVEYGINAFNQSRIHLKLRT
nr:hypothetical protein CVCH_109 [Cavernulicola chilensis]